MVQPKRPGNQEESISEGDNDNMNMPKGLQKLKMRDELKGMGIAADLVDLEAHIDSTLSYPENWRNVMGKYKRTDNKAKKSHTGRTFGISNIDMSYAAQSHAARSPRSRVMDEARSNKKTYTEKELSKRPSLLDSWFRRPGKSDLFGIDGFKKSNHKKKRKSKKRR